MPFSKIENWIFDLDNTLYPAECDLFAQIDVKMGEFVSQLLDTDLSSARKIQKQYFVEYGTTLNGLMKVHDIEPKTFLDYVHDIDHSPITHSLELSQALEKLPGKKIIFTNGTVEHAHNVTERLGITHHFSEVYDIVATNYIPKPDRQAYEHVLLEASITPKNTAMFEDLARNLKVPHELGMTTVLVQTEGTHPDENLGVLGTGQEEHVHFTTKNLAEYINKITQQM